MNAAMKELVPVADMAPRRTQLIGYLAFPSRSEHGHLNTNEYYLLREDCLGHGRDRYALIQKIDFFPARRITFLGPGDPLSQFTHFVLTLRKELTYA